jgi:hypothetical protein
MITEINMIEAEELMHQFNLEVFREPKNGVFNIAFQENNNNNAHDNNVNREFDKQYSQLAIDVKDTNAPDLIDYLASLGDHKVNVFLKTSLNNHHLYRNLAFEMEIYYNIWKRIHQHEGERRDTMIEAFVEQIKDCVPESTPEKQYGKDYIHCVNGRTSRVFSSLATLDDNYGVFKTNDVIKKEILDKAAFLYQDTVDQYLNDPDFGEAARSHREIVPNPKNDEEFNDILTKKMTNFINNDYGHINPLLRENILASVIEPFA